MLTGFDSNVPPVQRRWVVLVLAAAVLGISSSAVIVRGMAAPALAIAAYRVLGASLLLAPSLRSGLQEMSRRDALSVAIAGVCLGFHFHLWFLSLELTTVLRSTVLVCTVPLWTGLLEVAVDRRAPPVRFWMGVAIAVPAAAVIGVDGGEASRSGDLLALAASLLWALYFMIGRKVRQRVGASAYMCLVCAAAAVVLWPFALITGTTLGGWGTPTWALLVAAILGPQLIGHQGFVYAVRYVRASVVSALTVLEPVGATLLAVIFLGEWPPPLAVGAGLITLAGVALAIRAAPED